MSSLSLPISGFVSVPTFLSTSLHPHRASTPLPLNSESYLRAQSAASRLSVIDTVIPSGPPTAIIASPSAITTLAATTAPTTSLTATATIEPTSTINSASSDFTPSPASLRYVPTSDGSGNDRGGDPDHPGHAGLSAGRREGTPISTTHLVVLLVLLGTIGLGIITWLVCRCWAQRRLRHVRSREDVESSDSASVTELYREIKGGSSDKGNKDGKDDEGTKAEIAQMTPATHQPIDFDAAYQERQDAINAAKPSSPWNRGREFLAGKGKGKDGDVVNFVMMKDIRPQLMRRKSDPVQLPSTAPARAMIAKSDIANIVTSASMNRIHDIATAEESIAPSTPEQIESHWEQKRLECEEVAARLNRAEVIEPLGFVTVTFDDTIAAAAESSRSPKSQAHVHGYTFTSPRRSGSEVDLLQPPHTCQTVESTVPVESVKSRMRVKVAKGRKGIESLVQHKGVKSGRPLNPFKAALGPGSHVPGIIRNTVTPFPSPVSVVVKEVATPIRPLPSLPHSPLTTMTTESPASKLGRLMRARVKLTSTPASIISRCEPISAPCLLDPSLDPFERDPVTIMAKRMASHADLKKAIEYKAKETPEPTEVVKVVDEAETGKEKMMQELDFSVAAGSVAAQLAAQAAIMKRYREPIRSSAANDKIGDDLPGASHTTDLTSSTVATDTATP